MSGFFQNLLRDAAGAFFGSDYLRDYTHASKTFRSDSYANAPKYKFLFHTYFNINTEAWDGAGANLGILVKDIKLPSYTFQTHQMNQYNRKRIVQSKIKYDPVTITFHDDNKNTINKMWYAYYTYYYKDSSKPNVMFSGKRGSIRTQDGDSNSPQSTMADYNVRNTYQEKIQGDDDWGYIGESQSPNGTKIPFFKNITVFGFNQKNFTAYTLINPMITTFSHDTYNYDEGNGVMKNTMTIDYETVVYNEGAIDGNSPGDIVTGFGDPANYDRTVSPIAAPGSNATILGQGGLVDAAGGFVQDLQSGNILGAVKKAGTAYNTFKNVDLKSTVKLELQQGLQSALTETVVENRNVTFTFPSNGTSPSRVNTAGAPTTGAVTVPGDIGRNTAGQQVG
jgi:hypothetical protein